jgi:hypothetical protein
MYIACLWPSSALSACLQAEAQCLTQLSQLSRLQQLCFDAMVADGPASAAVLDNTALR